MSDDSSIRLRVSSSYKKPGESFASENSSVMSKKLRDRSQRQREQRRDRFLKQRRRKTEDDDTGFDPEDYTSWKDVEPIVDVIRLPTSTPRDRTQALKRLRLILSTEEAPLDLVVRNEVVVLLDNVLMSPVSEDQFEAAWSLANIASGDEKHARAVLPYSAHLVQLLSCQQSSLQEQCAWALGNLLLDGVEYFETLIAQGVVPGLLNAISSAVPATVAAALWTTQGLMKYDRDTVFESFAACQFLDRIGNLIQRARNETVIRELVWLLTYILQSGDHGNSVLGKPLYELLLVAAQSDDRETQVAAFKCFGNIFARENALVDIVVTEVPDFFPLARSVLLSDVHWSIHRELLWAISNLCGGTPDHLSLVLSSGIFEVVVEAFLRAQQLDVRIEAGFCIANSCADGVHAKEILTPPILDGFVRLLQAPQTSAIQFGLQFLEFVLHHLPEMRVVVEEAGGFARIDEISNNSRLPRDIQEHALRLLHDYVDNDREFMNPF